MGGRSCFITSGAFVDTLVCSMRVNNFNIYLQINFTACVHHNYTYGQVEMY